ncbi:hypothetical protein PR202_gb07520 [Eleusine coracana subsp. coracana]|uniref:NAC domain-containing protein n=1 Tax=Eleusine coracana subsp. coracana TaxID=191504 RepID=A0AAV5EBM2_ELECO|nr:hypothetical protein PR202_gb07520 [Eleusine coracana subsp. coracana]
MTLPPGFRFHPTDDELVGYYLKRKVDNLKIELEVIPVIDLYKSEPWELPEKSFLPKRDLEWFFFCPRDRKYPNGSRTNRATTTGYWKATGKDRRIACEGGVYGVRKTLVFYRGRAPGGERTDWVMHEYRLCQDLVHGASNFIGGYALCRVIKRHEAGLLQGEPPAARAKGTTNTGGARAQMSKVPSNSSLVSSEQLSTFTSANSGSPPPPPPPRLDMMSRGMCTSVAESCNNFQNSFAYGGDVCDASGLPPPLFVPTNNNSSHQSMCAPPPPQDMFFIGDDFPATAAADSSRLSAGHASFFDMGSVSELEWDDFSMAIPTTTNAFSTTAADMLCRQASDGGVDDLAAFFFSDDNRVVF